MLHASRKEVFICFASHDSLSIYILSNFRFSTLLECLVYIQFQNSLNPVSVILATYKNCSICSIICVNELKPGEQLRNVGVLDHIGHAHAIPSHAIKRFLYQQKRCLYSINTIYFRHVPVNYSKTPLICETLFSC